MENVLVIATALLVLTPAIVLHEFAHGWVAYRLGDSTAYLAGRLTLNPLKHVDPVGTIIIPGTLFLLYYFKLLPHLMLFGWAKPIPVNFRALRHPKQDMMCVGMAGPLVNVLLAFFLSRFWNLELSAAWRTLLEISIYLNLGLAVFNMIPIPPLDGSRLVMGLLPRELAIPYMKLERFGLLIVVVCLQLGLLRFVYPIVDILANALGVH